MSTCTGCGQPLDTGGNCYRCGTDRFSVPAQLKESSFPNPWIGDVPLGERQTHQDLRAIHATLERIAAALENERPDLREVHAHIHSLEGEIEQIKLDASDRWERMGSLMREVHRHLAALQKEVKQS